MSTQNQLAKKPKTIKDWLQSEQFANQIATALPKTIGQERFLRAAVTTLNINPALQNCDQGSLLNCCLQLAQYGLMPDGRNAHLVPFKGKCTLIIDYKGLIQLVLSSGKYTKIHADLICENDIFEYNLGEIHRHVPNWKDRGAPYLAYAIAISKEGQQVSAVMTIDEINKVRDSAFGSKKPDSPWQKWSAEMAKKTVFKRLSKFLDLSSEAQEVVDLDNKAEAGYEAPRPAQVEEPPPPPTPEEEPEPETPPVMEAEIVEEADDSHEELEKKDPPKAPANRASSKKAPAKKPEPKPAEPAEEEEDVFNLS